MSKAADMAKVTAKGGFHVFWGLVASAVISAFAAIVLAWVLGEDNYGVYAIVLTAPNLIGLFKDLGVNSAVIRYTAHLNVENQKSEIKKIFISGLIFKALLGLLLSIICFILAEFLAINFFQRPYVAPLIQIVSFVILAQALVNVSTAIFTGFERMHLNSIMIVSQSIIKAVFSPLLVILGLATFGAVTGFLMAYFLAAVIGLLFVWTIYNKLPRYSPQFELIKNIKVLLKFGLPLSFGGIITGFLSQFYLFLLAIYVSDNAIIGNYNVAFNFLILISFFSTPINTMLFPAFSKIEPEKEHDTLKNVYRISVKYTTLFVMPIATMLMILAEPAVSTLYGNSYSQAPLFLSVLAVNFFFSALGTYSTAHLINSQKQAKIKLIITIVTLCLGLPVGFILISNFGVLGLIITSIIAGIPPVIIGLVFIKRRFDLTLDWISSVKIFICCMISAGLTYIIINFISFASIFMLIIGSIFFLFSYILLLIISKTIKSNDITNIQEMTKGLGLVSKLVLVFLLVMRKLITYFGNR